MNAVIGDLGKLTRPPHRYHGGKWRLAPWIIERLPPPGDHVTYVEVFGGAAGVLLRRPRSKIEVYNDLDHQVVTFFRIIRDRASLSRLIDSIALTPFSRSEFRAAYDYSDNPIEATRRFIVRCYMGHGTCSIDPKDSNGFRSCDIRAGKSYAREWSGIPDAILAAASRFAGVTIENQDYRKLIPKFDDNKTVFYIDPPYVRGTRNAGGKGYVHEMSDEDHRQLAWLLHRCRGRIAISGYPSNLYDSLYRDWHRHETQARANGQRGAVRRTECLWTNY
jgi:DNA adenine methylase